MSLKNTDNLVYRISYKKPWYPFWITKSVTGHAYQPSLGNMELYLTDGTILVIPKWHEFYYKLGTDYVAVKKASIKEEAGK